MAWRPRSNGSVLLSRTLLLTVCAPALVPLGGCAPDPGTHSPPPPNILFIILDDVGIDQLRSFNPAAPNPPQTPNIDKLAAAGVKFDRFSTMPECSPSRTCIFTGRYPLRTGVTAAILDEDLTNAQCSRFEVTTPKVLRAAGYQSAMIGKFHMAGPDLNPDGQGTPVALGWDYFNGVLFGGPPAIDPTVGGQYTEDTTTYCWGFPIGDQRGVGWFQDANGVVECDDRNGGGYTGKEVLAKGGIPALDAGGTFASTCADAQASGRPVVFTNYNGYYAWPKDVNDSSGAVKTIGRGYAVTAETNEGIKWIRSQTSKSPQADPWMATVSYLGIHTPYQPPPDELYPPGFVWPSNVSQADCQSLPTIKVISNLMLEAIDKEIGRLLVSVGLATRGDAGELIYDPQASNTMIVIAGDNGTFLRSVLHPYDPLRAKGTPYETGVSAPLIVAGPLVQSPGRTVHHMVNCVDLFQLFGEIAGVDVHTAVPSSHVLDSQPMLAYLTNPDQESFRQYNFTQVGNGLKAPSVHIWPTVIALDPANGPISINIGTDILFTNQSLAEDNGGTWYGPGGSQVFDTACDVRAAGIYNSLSITATRMWAIRNEQYKLVKFDRATCDQDLGEFEFYDLSPTPSNPVNPLGLDEAPFDLLESGQPTQLSSDQLANYNELQQALDELLNSEPVCYGDGNLDKQVDQLDIDGVTQYSGQPSWFDFNNDGITDQLDLDCVESNLGNNCLTGGPGTACN